MEAGPSTPGKQCPGLLQSSGGRGKVLHLESEGGKERNSLSQTAASGDGETL